MTITIHVPEFSYYRRPWATAVAPALAGCTLVLGPGVHALLGRNGAGKSTLFGVLSGTLAANVSVFTNGRSLSRQAFQEATGLLPQQAGFPPRAKVSDFLAYAAWLKGMPRGRIDEAVSRALRLANVESCSHEKCGSLSGGTMRRVHLAAALVHEPSALLLDEPTTGLDPMERARFHDTIAAVSETAGVLMATHLLEDVAATAHEVTVIERGVIVWTGTPEELGVLTEQVGWGTVI